MEHGKFGGAVRWGLAPWLGWVGLLLAGAGLSANPGNLPAWFPPGTRLDATVPTPQATLGFDIGERHLEHYQLLAYLRVLAAASPRVDLVEVGRSHGGRPLVLLTASAPANLARAAEIQKQSQQLADPSLSTGVDLTKAPAIVLLQYGVHGDEPSATNAAPLIAYYLAAAQGPEIDALLANTVVLIDPCINPDGFDRFAQWANANVGKVANPDPLTREHQQPFPRGRHNYYWFDLNRDYLAATQPETKARLVWYRQWLPNVVGDFHEMGTSSTYFFQPGVPERNHPLIPKRTFDLTRSLANFHAKALDRLNSMYFSEERFDDFYVGKGSTYTDLNGAIGILFEQASARGLVQDGDYGRVTFTLAIQNQVATSLSTLEGSAALRNELLLHKRDFFRESFEEGRSASNAGWVVAAPGDPSRLSAFLEVLAAHGLQSFALTRDLVVGGRSFPATTAYLIPAEQAGYRYLLSLMEKRTTFGDDRFYDISAWTLPLSFNLVSAEVPTPLDRGLLGQPWAPAALARPAPERAAIAYIVGWGTQYAPRALGRLLAADLKLLVATQPMAVRAGAANQPRPVNPGDIIVWTREQPLTPEALQGLMGTLAREDGVEVIATNTSLTPTGPDLGSGTLSPLEPGRVALIVGEGLSPTATGSVWHAFDVEQRLPLTMLDITRLAITDLSRYSTILLTDGNYRLAGTAGATALGQFVDNGGTLVAIGSALRWVIREKIVDAELAPNPSAGAPARLPFAESERTGGRQVVAGIILQAQLDATHPLGWGYAQDTLPVFRGDRLFLRPAKDRYSTPLLLGDAPLLAGYVSPENLRAFGGTASAVVVSRGRGRAILLADDPTFRAFWQGTYRLLFNATFHGPRMRPASGGDAGDEEQEMQ